VQYAELIPGGEQAIVVLRLNSGGTQYSHYVFAYSLQKGKPVLLGAAHCGDRSSFGLSRVWAQQQELVIELFNPEKRTGDCCSERGVAT